MRGRATILPRPPIAGDDAAGRAERDRRRRVANGDTGRNQRTTIILQTSVQDRLIAAGGTTIVVAVFGYALLLGLSVDMRARVQDVMTVLTLDAPPPPPPVVPPPPPPKHKAPQGRGSPPNLRNKATAIVTPPPVIVPPAPPPVLAAAKPDVGAATQTAKALQPGPGEGAGGAGNGEGSGGYGDGAGDDDIPPRQIGGRLSYADLPASLRQNGASGDVEVRYYVLVTGRVGSCSITRSSGNPDLDAATCRLVQQRFRFDPSRTPDGMPVRSILEQKLSWDQDKGFRQYD